MKRSSTLKTEAPGTWLGKGLRAGLALIVGMASCWAAGPAHAQAPYPNKPIKWIVPFAPGGSGDLIARVLAERMGQAMGQPVIIENRGGNGSVLGTELAAKAAPDGYTWLAVTLAHAVNQSLFANLPYSLEKNLLPVVQLASSPLVLVVNASSEATTLKAFLERAKAKVLNAGSSGNGTPPHLGLELLAEHLG